MKTFKVWIPDWMGDEPEEVVAFDHEAAALALVEEKDDEYTTMDHPILMAVAEPDSEELKTFEVSSEPSIRYRAKETK